MPTVCLDTNVWFYALAKPAEDEQGKHIAARQLIEDIQSPVITPQIVNELCANLLRKRAWNEADIRLLVGDLLARCHLHAPDAGWHEEASRLRERHGFAFWDALVVASALAANCDTLYSEDMQHGQMIANKLTVTDPFRG
jgi:predicted nucleic acid-binding protein